MAIITDDRTFRGTIISLKTSGHTYGREVDRQPVSWDNFEARVDEHCNTKNTLGKMGLHVGDYIAVNALPEISESGYINARHLDNKAGVALVLVTTRATRENKVSLPVTCKLLFTIAEEVGMGASTVLQKNVAEMVTVDNATVAEEQNSSEPGVSICMMDSQQL